MSARLSLLASSLFALTLGCAEDASAPKPAASSWIAALTAAQCNYFAVDGKIQICHRTQSGKHPYTILRIAETACANAHAAHEGDYVAIDDPTCKGGGCLPAGAPCDATLPCCGDAACGADGLCATAGCASTDICQAWYDEGWSAGYNEGNAAGCDNRDPAMPCLPSSDYDAAAACQDICDDDAEAMELGYWAGVHGGYHAAFTAACGDDCASR